MPFETTSYPLDCPAVLWDILTRVQSNNRNINDELLVAIAKHVAEHDVDLSDDEAYVVEAVLEGA